MMLSILSYVCFDKLHVQIFCSFKKMQLFVSFLLSLKWKVNWLSPVWLFVTVAHQASPSMRFSRQEYWSGLPFPSPGDLLHLGIELRSPALKADTLPSEPPGKSRRCLILQVLLGGGEVQRTQSPLEWVLIKEKQKMGESRKQTDPDKTVPRHHSFRQPLRHNLWD